MPKPYVFIGFDVEDPINPESDDVLLRLAHTFDKAGLPACFFMGLSGFINGVLYSVTRS